MHVVNNNEAVDVQKRNSDLYLSTINLMAILENGDVFFLIMSCVMSENSLDCKIETFSLITLDTLEHEQALNGMRRENSF